MNSPFRVLFVCAMNLQRSVTAEHLYQTDARLAVRSGGVRFDAQHRVDEDDLRWANRVVVMESEHRLWIEMRFDSLDLPPIVVLGIPDEFEYMDLGLQKILRRELDPLIARWLEEGR